MSSSDSLIVDQDEFDGLCREARHAGIVAFDTEFVSESSYRPELGLLQFATANRAVAADPLQIANLDAWWQLMCDDETTVVVHGGQAEIAFCLHHAGSPPQRLVDIQLAEGLRSRSYPLGYAAIVSRVLGARVHGGQTRTDWSRRPLSHEQVAYALEDVQFILPVWQRQSAALAELGRLDWAEAEFARMIDDIVAESQRERWKRLPGVHRLSPRERAVARELASWRDREAACRNRPVRRILRDDLLIDLARRQPTSRKQVLATRDMQREDYRRHADSLLECIRRGREIPEDELPPPVDQKRSRNTAVDEPVLAKLLGLALSNRCAELELSRQLVGTSDDLVDLVRWHLGGCNEQSRPRLAAGWRAEVCGNLLTDLLDGRMALRVGNLHSTHPLVFEQTARKRKRT